MLPTPPLNIHGTSIRLDRSGCSNGSSHSSSFLHPTIWFAASRSFSMTLDKVHSARHSMMSLVRLVASGGLLDDPHGLFTPRDEITWRSSSDTHQRSRL